MALDQGATPEVEQVIDQQPEAVIEPVRMEDTIRDTLRELEAKGVTPDASEDTPDTPEEKAQRIRDDKGKFAAKEAPPATPEVPATPAVPEAATDPLATAPNTWKKEVAATWATLPPEARAEITRREADFHKGIEGYKQAAQFAQSVDRAMEPYKQTLQSLGLAPEKAIGELMAADHLLRNGSAEQKSAYLAQLAHNYGIDLGVANTQQQNIDPRAYSLEQENLRLRNQLQDNDSRVKQAENETLNSTISSFAADPKHSHFESVKGHMSALLQAGQAQDLASAYEQAVWANPATRATALAEQQAVSRAEATQKAQAAKTAASVNTQRRPSMPVSEPIGTMADTIRASLRRMQGA